MPIDCIGSTPTPPSMTTSMRLAASLFINTINAVQGSHYCKDKLPAYTTRIAETRLESLNSFCVQQSQCDIHHVRQKGHLHMPSAEYQAVVCPWQGCG